MSSNGGVGGEGVLNGSDNAVINEIVGMALHGLRLDRAVALASGSSRSVAAKLVGDGAVLLDGEVVTERAHRIKVRQRLSIAVADMPSPTELAAESGVEFTVIHSDDDVLVVDKPSGLVVHPGAGHPDGTLVNGLLARYPEIASVGEAGRPGIVHRLDRGTSGLMMVARTARAHACLTSQLREHGPVRVYTTLVWGHPAADIGVIEAPVGRSSRHPTRMAVTRQGRPAVTHYRVLRRLRISDPIALLSCRLETGRTHQIRVHLQAIGHPVVGDRAYAKPGRSRPDGAGYGFTVAANASSDMTAASAVFGSVIVLERPFLHAGSLAFRHPATGMAVEFESGLPDDLAALLRRAEADDVSS